ncbi:MAG: REP-associated tyrosine transposase [Planctomycetota bacterium]
MLTYRLADSLPREVVEKLLAPADRNDVKAETRRHIETYLDAGHGACWLARPVVARIVRDAWLHFNRQRYLLHAWVIMPNHVHLIVEESPDFPLREIVHSWKSFSVKEANRVLGRTGAFWQREYWDRFIRHRAHYDSSLSYIYDNPVKAGLVDDVARWKWSSWNKRTDGSGRARRD